MAQRESLPFLIAERTAAQTYTVRSAGGAELRIGPPGASDVFTPVELLQAAIAGCASLSAEAQLTQQLGGGFQSAVAVDAVLDGTEDRVAELASRISVDMSELDTEERAKLTSRADRSIDKLCTVKRSLNHGITTATEVRGAE